MKRRIISTGFFTAITLFCNAQNKDLNAQSYHIGPTHLQSRWAKDVTPDNALKEYPRPSLQRKNWQNLNGLWEYAITDSAVISPDSFDGNILVPYPIESALSGVEKTLMPDKRLWYKRTIQRPATTSSERVMLNFGAVDWQATIFINKKQVGQHSGGYQNFSYDITEFLKKGENEILVKVYDPSDKGPNPHGKQVLNPENIYYTPSSGIWQTVWMEVLPATHISHITSTPDIDNGILKLAIQTVGNPDNTKLEIVASADGKPISESKIQPTVNNGVATIKVPDSRLWSPDDPFLYELTIKLIKGNKTVDEVKSYFGMRKIDIQKDEKGTDRIFLNNKYTYNLGILDQGFWPDGLYTAPTDEALAFDIKTIKSLGFNTIRKHIKIEPERWYYHADKLGILVWQDFVNPPHGLPAGSRPIFEKEVQETMDQLHNHPSIVTWVLFNERWGAYDQERLTAWVKKYDPSRIVNGHSGELLYIDDQLRDPADHPWIGSDMTDVHSYPDPKNAPAQANKARVVGEFGGIGVTVPGHEWDDMQGWGYVQIKPAELKERYKGMMLELKKLEAAGLSASIYTQPFDVEGEENGLLTYDREIIKIPVNDVRAINKELVPQTNGFALDPHFNIAAAIDTTDSNTQYAEMMTRFKDGIRDSTFLRRLTVMAIRKKDLDHATQIGNEYISILSTPLSKENLFFINNITKSTRDKGFLLFNQHLAEVNANFGPAYAEKKIKRIIDVEEIQPYTKDGNPNVNWDSLEQKISAKYGDLGEELVLGRRMLYNITTKRDWSEFSKYYVLYFKKALSRPEYDINNVTWVIFEHVTDPEVLAFAGDVMKYAIQNSDQTPEAYDTYANLLHKINKSGEAIQWEEKVVALKKGTPDEKVYADILQKMKSGQPTWPTNN